MSMVDEYKYFTMFGGISIIDEVVQCTVCRGSQGTYTAVQETMYKLQLASGEYIESIYIEHSTRRIAYCVQTIEVN